MLNQLARYDPVVGLIEEVPGATVLEVGSGNRGVARFLSARWQITASDVDYTDYGTATETDGSGRAERVLADVCSLPFANAAFDVVAAVDLLEHVEVPRRKRALDELVRVAARRVIVAVPCGPQALVSDRRLAAFYERIGAELPVWLKEHLEHGFPDERELQAALAPHGRLRLLPNEWIPAHELVARIEAVPHLGRVSQILSRRLERAFRRERPLSGRVARGVLRAMRAWDRSPSYRTIAVLDRDGG